MKTDKILLNLSSLDNVETYKKLGVSNFLFPLENYSIGYSTFTLDEIKDFKDDVYVLVNRLLTDDDIDNFLNLEVPSNVKGFIIEDIGLYYALKDKNYELINFQNHLNNSYKTINFWLERYDSLVVSTDITFDEINEIIENASKPLVLNTVGYPMIMYSRRHLLSTYYSHMDRDTKEIMDIRESHSNINFKLKESEYGTAVFDNNLIDAREEFGTLDDNNIKFYLINTMFLSEEEIENAIKGMPLSNSTKGFLNKKTIYRVGDIK